MPETLASSAGQPAPLASVSGTPARLETLTAAHVQIHDAFEGRSPGQDPARAGAEDPAGAAVAAGADLLAAARGHPGLAQRHAVLVVARLRRGGLRRPALGRGPAD